MLDRLRDLHKYGQDNPDFNDERDSGTDEEMGVADTNEFMAEFFTDVANVRIQLRKIENNNEVLSEKYTEQLQKINPAEKKKLSSEADKIVVEINQIAKEIKDTLELMVKADTSASVQKMQEQSAEERIKKNTQSSLVQRFVELMEEYQGIQAKFKTQHQDNVKRQVLVVRPDATIEEIAEVIQSGEAERIFADHSMKREQAATQALSYIRDRHQEIVKIERSLNELQQLFIDMAVLVAEQSEMITSIETNIGNATDYIKDATVNLKKANKLQKRSRKCMIAIIILCVALLGAVLTVVLYFTVGPGAASTNSTTPSAAPSGSAAVVFGDFSILNNAIDWAAYKK